MRRYAVWMLTVGAAVAGVSCGESPTVVPTPPPPTTTLAAQPSPSPAPSPSPSPISSQECTFAPGPVARFAISPRELRTDGVQADIYVRARTGWDEVVCLDRAKSHRLDFNANQRNADGRECCFEGSATWQTIDPAGIVIATSSRHERDMIWRLNVEPDGRETSFELEAELEGLKSYPWQSGSGYRREPFRVVTMSASEITRDCHCIYRGNGIYEGARCPKL